MATTVSDLIHSSMRLIGSIAAGETMETEELNDAFVALNQMLSSWNTEGASLVGRKRLQVPTSNVNNYQLSERPIKIDAAACSLSGLDNPLEIVDAAGWEAIPIPEKQMQSIFIRKLYCDYLYPVSTVFIWPIPRVSGGLLELWIFAPMPAFPALDSVIDLPPGYEAGLRFNLATVLAPEYGRPVDPLTAAGAQNFKASLVQLNAGNHMRSQAPVPAAAQ
jgi:hypothetical protein